MYKDADNFGVQRTVPYNSTLIYFREAPLTSHSHLCHRRIGADLTSDLLAYKVYIAFPLVLTKKLFASR